jgi:hypothetical protein
MIIKSATGLAFAAACLTTIASLATANAQPANSSGTASGSYWTSPGAYGTPPGTYGTAPGAYGTAPGTYGAAAPGTYGSTSGTYAPQTQYVPPPPAGGTGGTEVLSNSPQGYQQPPGWSPSRNVAESERYDRLLETNRGFREARMRRECGPITDPQLHQQCIESFAQDEPSGTARGYGSSSAIGGHGSSYGR